MTREGKPGELVFSILFLIAAAVLLSQIDSQVKWSNGKALVAQPRFWPSIGIAMMIAFGVVHLWGAWARRQSGSLGEIWFWLRGLEYAGWFIAYVLLVPVLGYLPASVLVAVILGLRLGFRGARAIGACIAVACTIVVIFKVALRVNMPAGQLYHALPKTLADFMITYL